MSLILYPTTESAFDSNGIGILSDVIDDEIYEELNGQFELTLQYPVDGVHFSEIVADAYITAKPNPVSEPQPFRIYRITKPMRGVVTVYARHMAYRNKKIVVSPFTAVSAPDAMTALKNNAVNTCPFEFWTDKETEANMAVAVPTDIWTLLGSSKGSILDTYGGEYEFDRYNIKLWDRRGADRGVSIRYGKNLTDLKQDENIANVFTGVYPYWTDGSGALVTLPEKYINGPGTYAEEKIMPLDLSEEFETQPTEEQLRERAEKYITDNDIGKPDVSWTVEFVQLEQTEEYKGQALLERVLLGDTVSVVFSKLGVDVSARAVAARYKPTLGRYKNITLGKVKANLASTIVRQQQEIEQVKKPSNLQAAVDRATNWITNGKGHMIAVRAEDGTWQEICSLDEPDINQAVKVWRWNNGGLGFSSTGYAGPYRLAITQDGKIVADFITAGTLDAAVVKVINLVANNIVSGRLSSVDGKAYFDLDHGCFAIDDAFNRAPYTMRGIRMMDCMLHGILHDSTDGVNAQNLVQMFCIYFDETGAYFNDGVGLPSGKPIRIYSSGGLELGRADYPTVIRGSEIDILGAPLRISGKSMKWVDSGSGYSYLVGVDE